MFCFNKIKLNMTFNKKIFRKNVLIILIGLFSCINTAEAQKNIMFTNGTGIPHKTFEDEFLTHKKCSEWWYTTGYFEDEGNNMFAFQYTLARIKVFGIRFHIMLTSVTDLQTGIHYYGQQTAFWGKDVITNLQETTFGDVASIKYSSNNKSGLGKMDLTMTDKDYFLHLNLEAQKPPVWHCEDGKLQMGITDNPKQVTYYYSFTNLAANGTLVLNGKEHKVKGKAWFDKQGGTYSLTNPLTNWEWFSFRFFDNEEIMLFYFPQTGYIDGTYIPENGEYMRLNNYEVSPLDSITEPDTKYIFTYGWEIKMPGIKDQEYTLKPKIDGQFNVSFYELIADVFDNEGNIVGYCYVELLPGARNKKLNNSLAFKKR